MHQVNVFFCNFFLFYEEFNNHRLSPRDEALLITRQRPKGLKVVSYLKFSIDSENPFLGGQSLRVLGEK